MGDADWRDEHHLECVAKATEEAGFFVAGLPAPGCACNSCWGTMANRHATSVLHGMLYGSTDQALIDTVAGLARGWTGTSVDLVAAARKLLA